MMPVFLRMKPSSCPQGALKPVPGTQAQKAGAEPSNAAALSPECLACEATEVPMHGRLPEIVNFSIQAVVPTGGLILPAKEQKFNYWITNYSEIGLAY